LKFSVLRDALGGRFSQLCVHEKSRRHEIHGSWQGWGWQAFNKTPRINMSFKNIFLGWIKGMAPVGLAWAMASAPAAAQSTHVPEKPNQAPGDIGAPPPVDPARCSGGDKKFIYWAAKEQVFRIPFDPKLPSIYAIPDRDVSGQGLRAREEIPPPPDPKEPEGCYGNPLRGLAMPYFAEFANRTYQELMGRPRLASAMYLGGSAIAWETEFGPGVWPRVNDRLFQMRPYCKTRDSGIQVCLMSSNQDPNTFNPAHVYVIPRSLLPSYIGSKDIRFVVHAALGYSPEYVAIESNFKIFGNVLMQLSPTIKSSEIDLMIPYHVKLIRHVIDAHVPDYAWRPRR
jgi:hypothetical protein